MTTTQKRWRIGAFARATNVTVRALHHYDRLGLLVPSSRTPGGHRCYTGEDVRRLHTILALRGFGLTLEEIGRALDRAGDDPRDILRRQLDETDERLRRAARLRARLLGVLGALDRLGEPSTSEFVNLIEAMATVDRPLTPEQVQQISAERQQRVGRPGRGEVTELGRGRQKAVARLSDRQLAEMRRNRARLMSGASGSWS